MHCIELHCIVLNCIYCITSMMYCVVLHCIFYIELHRIVYYVVLYCDIICFGTMQYGGPSMIVLYCLVLHGVLFLLHYTILYLWQLLQLVLQ